MLLWFLAAGGALAAVVALLVARSLRRRLDRLTDAYWELRYQYTVLRADMARLDPSATARASQEQETPAPQSPQTSFIPLSSLKK